MQQFAPNMTSGMIQTLRRLIVDARNIHGIDHLDDIIKHLFTAEFTSDVVVFMEEVDNAYE